MHIYTYFVSFVKPDGGFDNATVVLAGKIKTSEHIQSVQQAVEGTLLHFVQIDYEKVKKPDADTQAP